MKKLLSVLFVITITAIASAQTKDTLSITAGYMFNPQAYLSLKNPKSGTAVIAPLLASVSFSEGKVFLNTAYNLNINAVAIVFAYQFSSHVGGYIFQNKRILNHGAYSSIGITTSVASGRALSFIEIGTSWDNTGAYVYSGIFIPFKLKFKFKIK